MPVKLNKVIKDLNVGLSTVVEFLNKKGFAIDNNPNVKITDEQLDLLNKEFGGTPPSKTGMTAILGGGKPKQQSPQQSSQPVREEIKITPEPTGTGIKVKGKMELPDRNNGKSKFQTHSSNPRDKKDYNADRRDKRAFTEAGKKPTDKLANSAMPSTVAGTVPSRKFDAHKETPPATIKPVDTPREKQVLETAETSGESTKINTYDKRNQTAQEQKAPFMRDREHDKQKKQAFPPKTETVVKPDAPADTVLQPKVSEKKEELFRLDPPPPRVNFNVVGALPKEETVKIDQERVQRRKSKNEKRRERAARRKAEQRNGAQSIDKMQRPAFSLDKPRQQPQPQTAGAQITDATGKRPPRQRIKKERIDVVTTPGSNTRRDDRPSHFNHPNSQNRPNNQNNQNRPNSQNRPNNSNRPNNQNRSKPQQQHYQRPVRAAVSEVDVQKQVKETLARLTDKANKGRGAKYRREKRDAAADRERELLAEEERESKVLKLTEFVTANDLANMMDIPVTKVISTCMSIGIMVSINQRIDAETINIVAEEFGYTTEYVSADVVEAITEENDKEEDLQPRPPIITVMGHVDHGKTSLLDNIRKTNVIAGEAGGITQHIGAYNVKLPNDRYITFLDTPGHEAFTAMRARGAKVTDIAIIIVAADDSVMPQTVEAINHASAAGVPMVFAINKIDKPHANSEKIKEQLANMNYLVEDWGGKYQCQEISAKQGLGVPELLEKVLLEADMLELKANPKRRAIGSIIESSLDKGRGFVSTILVSNGTLKQGDVVLAGTHYGRIKAMFNERNTRIEQAGPSEPALILGLDGAPQAGDAFHVLESEQEAREIASRREQLQRELGLRTQKRFGLEELGRRRALGDFHELNLIVKGDVDGSVEAISDSLIKLATQEIQVNVIHKAVGQISESDVSLAATANAVIIGFQVRPSVQARRLAENDGVEIRMYSIIYDAINDVKDAMEGMLSPEIHEEQSGEIEVLQVFKITKVGTVAGCIVKEGKIKRTNKVRLIRDGIVVYTGDLGSLKRFKDEVKEVYSGQDCGIHINNFSDVRVGDLIESFDQIEVKKTL